MPTTIDSENAKQIRQPMDVLIKMTVPEDIAITASGYASSAKVADGVLDERSWPMRQLADLQGEGFQLNGTCVLYDPSMTASETNGKIGVRSNVGQPVSVTITGSSRINMMTVYADAATVAYSGGSASIVAGVAVIPVGATSTTLTFSPNSSTTRAEVTAVTPGAIFEITNDILISATVSLRSDLSLVDQTLPESELNVEVYTDADLSDAVATIPKDTPITYTAGYPGDMSPEREFYLADQITWADNVLSIHAVDAVHFLDQFTIVAPLTDIDSEEFANIVLYVFERAGVDATDYLLTRWGAEYNRWILRENTNARELLAFLNQCFNLTDDTGRLIDGSATLYSELSFAYVDAGRPRVRSRQYYAHNYQISEDDCADIKKHIEPAISQVRAEHERITNPRVEDADWDTVVQQIGSATFAKNVGTSLSFDKYATIWAIGLALGPNGDSDDAKKMETRYGVLWGGLGVYHVVPTRNDGSWYTHTPQIDDPYDAGSKLAIGSIPQEEFMDYEADPSSKVFSAFVPWSQRYDDFPYDSNPSHKITTATQMWNVLTAAGIMASNTASIDLDIYGLAYNIENQIKTYNHGSSGRTYEYSELPIIGQMAAKKSNSTNIEIYPSKMLAAPMYRSNVTGSFTWKGDPRIQPRDYFTFTRLDGTTEECTFENITLHHEGGGTYAEITYRKGRI